MSVEAVAWALQQPLSGTQKILLIGLANHATAEFDNARPAVATLAKYTHCHERNVQRALRKLEDDGWIAQTGSHPVAGRADRAVLVYRLCSERGGASATASRGGATATPSGERGGAGVPNGVAPAPPEPSIEPSNNDSGAKAPSSSEASRHPEAARLSCLLASLIRSHDAKATLKPRDDKWVRDMRLLLNDRDDNTAEVEFVIRWCQADEFWQSNVLSPAKLRKQFTQLLLRARRQAGRGEHLHEADPLAGYSAEARARMERTARRLGVSVKDLIKTNPTHHGGTNGTQLGDRAGTASAQPLLSSGATS